MTALANQLQRPQVQSYVLISQAKSLPAGIILLMRSDVHICLQPRSTQLCFSSSAEDAYPTIRIDRRKRRQASISPKIQLVRFGTTDIYRYASPGIMPTRHARNLLQSRILFCTVEKRDHTWPQLLARQAKV